MRDVGLHGKNSLHVEMPCESSLFNQFNYKLRKLLDPIDRSINRGTLKIVKADPLITRTRYEHTRMPKECDSPDKINDKTNK